MTPRMEELAVWQARQGFPRCGTKCSKLATNTCDEARRCVGVMDVKSAFSYGRTRRPNFIEVPTEDPGSKLRGASAKVVGSLCGTHNTPMIWQDCFRCQMKVLGFLYLLRVPCMFHHETKKVST